MRRLATVAMLVCLILTPALVVQSAGTKGSKDSQVEEGYVKTRDGVRLFYQKIGSGNQTVIIPAALFLTRDFRQLADGRTLIFYDMRNRGRSDAVKDLARVTIQEDVRDLEAIRAHFGVKRFSTIG